MTTATIHKDGANVSKITITGHAFYANEGNDIVCAGISMLAYTIGNQLLMIDEEPTNVIIEEGMFELENQNITEKNQLLFATLITGLKMIEEQYPKNLKIKEV